MNAREQFFYDNAGYSYGPTETAEQGRERCAARLVMAEVWARNDGYSFDWSIDPTGDSSEWNDDEPAWEQWVCVMRDRDGNTCQSLCGIDFGRDGTPWGNDYRRVVEAELACEEMPT